VRQKIGEADIEDIVSGQPKKIELPTGGTEPPVFRHGEGGVKQRVLPGNEKFVAGDHIPRSESGGKGAGQQGAPDGAAKTILSLRSHKRNFSTTSSMASNYRIW
jgi:uncharacterized sporulation protein YeaH/YhbH (DUF444 family)